MFKDFQRESFDKSRLIKQTISYLIFFKILLFISTSKCNEERKKNQN